MNKFEEQPIAGSDLCDIRDSVARLSPLAASEASRARQAHFTFAAAGRGAAMECLISAREDAPLALIEIKNRRAFAHKSIFDSLMIHRKGG